MSFLKKDLFYSSVFGGLLVWFLVFLITPVSAVNSLSYETVLFIGLNVFALVFGYTILPQNNNTQKSKSHFSNQFIYTTIIIVLVSFIIRYFDLFVSRGLEIGNSIAENRRLVGETNPNFLFIIASILRHLFFIPLILLLSNKQKNNRLFYVAIALFFLPFLEGYIRGSRNTFFFSFSFLLLILAYFKKLKFNKKQLAIYGIAIIFLFLTATSLLIKREGKEKKTDIKKLISNAIYSDFLKTNETVATYISEIKNPSVQKLTISALQFGQYYTHGIFEFDHLVKHYQKKELTIQKGKFMFFTITRFTNKYKLTNIDQHKVQRTHPRLFTFITLFGGLFLDFGWLSVLIMFLFGMLQKHTKNTISNGKNQYIPLFLFFLFVNFFMYSFNFISGGGTYNIFACIFVIILFTFLRIKTTR